VNEEGNREQRSADFAHHTQVQSLRCGYENFRFVSGEVEDGRKWGGHATEEGNECSRSIKQAIRGQNKGTTITIYPDRLTLRGTRDKRKHSRLQHEIETVKLVLSLLFFVGFILLSAFVSQGQCNGETSCVIS
jgi:hypothetical protein